MEKAEESSIDFQQKAPDQQQLKLVHGQNIQVIDGKMFVTISKDFIYDVNKILGKGAFGIVYLGYRVGNHKSIDDMQKVAVKMIQVPDRQERLNEIKMLIETTHNQIQCFLNLRDNPNILELYEFKRYGNLIYMVLEYCNTKDLNYFISTYKNLSEFDVRYYFMQILHGMKQMKTKKFVHRDLKPQNIMVHDKIMKIADFGCVRNMQDLKNDQLLQSAVGTVVTQAPQLIQLKPYTDKCDIYSLGCILYFMIYKTYPYSEPTLDQLKEQFLQFPPKIPEISEQLKTAIKRMLRIQQKDRIEWQELFQLNIFNQEIIMRQNPLRYRKTLSRNLKKRQSIHQDIKQAIEAQIPLKWANYISSGKYQNERQEKLQRKINQKVNFEIFKIQVLREISNSLRSYKYVGYGAIIQVKLLKELICIGIDKFITDWIDRLSRAITKTGPLEIFEKQELRQFQQLPNKAYIVNKITGQLKYLSSKTKMSISFQKTEEECRRKCYQYKIFENFRFLFGQSIMDYKKFDDQLKSAIRDLIYYLKNQIPLQRIHKNDPTVLKAKDTIMVVHHLFMLYMKDQLFKRSDSALNYTQLLDDDFRKVGQQEFSGIFDTVVHLLKNIN